MVDELFALYVRREGLGQLCLRWCCELIHVYVLEWLCPIEGDPWVLLDLINCDAILWLLLQQLDDEVMERSLDHLCRVLRFCGLYQTVQLGVLTAHEWVFSGGHEV